MDVAYWTVATLLAGIHLYAGGKKVAQSKERLTPMMGWVRFGGSGPSRPSAPPG